ncbi:MAG: DUF5009 domain-containing protein [Tannerellaceae bacterium]|nr:DUF5009 domain-containing protein [Tannerellaceae bacterium]
MKTQPVQRLESLDILRGFDLFCLVMLEPFFGPLSNAVDTPWFNSFMWNFRHIEWQGFSPWDLVMPLFLFMAGVSMPFALSRYKNSPDKGALFKRILKRVLLLWIFGMMCQGNLLALDPGRIYLYSNTLQSIAIGYLIAAILFLTCSIRTQIGISIALLLIYWGAMEFITVGSYGGGNYTPDGNLAEWIDRAVLGRFRDGATVVNGEVVFSKYYRYTWILSSLNFGVTVLTGLFAGHILKQKEKTNRSKLLTLIGVGAGMVVLGWAWHFQLPVIKKIWTSSMVLVSSGYCFLLMALFFYWIDYKGHRKYLGWLKIYGMNSILAYMLAQIIDFSCIGNSLLYGLQPHLGNYYPVLIALSNVTILFFILRECYKRGIFLRV